MAESGMVSEDRLPPSGRAPGRVGAPPQRPAARHVRDGVLTARPSPRALAELAEGLAHDLKNQLTVVGAAVQLARGRDAGDADDFLDRAWRAAMHAAGLVDEVLAYARGGGQDDGEQSSDLADALETAVAGAWGHAARCGVELEMRCATLRLPAVDCHPAGLRLLLVRLLRRSAEACGPGAHLLVEAGLRGSLATVAVHRILPQGACGCRAGQAGADAPHSCWAVDLSEVCALADEMGVACTSQSTGPVVWMRPAEVGAWGGCSRPD